MRKQLALTTEQKLQRESLPFKEIKDLQKNFLNEFNHMYARPAMRQQLVHDFKRIFYRHEDGSYTQRPGLFEGNAFSDGRSFAEMSAMYSPDISPGDDIKARFTLSYILSHKYGSSTKGRLFNFYGVVPEKGITIYQVTDLAKVFTHSTFNPLRLENYEFYSRGFGSPSNATIFTNLYWDLANSAWMTTVATPDVAGASGKHKILVGADVLLDDLIQRTANPTIQRSYSTLFQVDADGTLIYHPDYTGIIQSSAGKASIKSLRLESDYPLLEAARSAVPGKVTLVTTPKEIMAVGIIPETPWALTVHYPKSLIRPAIFQNLVIVIAVGLLTLLVEIFIIRSILLRQVAIPLAQLMQAMRLVGRGSARVNNNLFSTHSQDEIGALASEFASMASRIHDAHVLLERKVQERTAALEEANRKLTEMSTTDELTGLANRRRFDQVVANEWNRAMRSKDSLALMMVDVDWFKKYNDHYGHQAGDECLQHVAQILRANVLRSGDLVARYGGEEFAVVVPAANTEDALRLAQRLCQAVDAIQLPHDRSTFGHLTISIGVAALIPESTQAPEILMRKADQALYRAKEMGRNQAVMHVT